MLQTFFPLHLNSIRPGHDPIRLCCPKELQFPVLLEVMWIEADEASMLILRVTDASSPS